MLAAQTTAASRWMSLVLTAVSVAASAYPCQAGERVALVIGNSSYAGAAALRNPGNDADAVEKALNDLGFSVIKKKDLDQQGMEGALVALRRKLAKGDLAMFVYSGHGLQVSGENYLIPIGAAIQEEYQVKRRCFEVSQVIDAMVEAESNLKIVVLDCCRDNPFQRSWRRSSSSRGGLAAISNVPEGTMIAFSTSPNTTADDGRGSNSPYTEQLVAALRARPAGGLELIDVFLSASRTVKKRTGQVPWLNLEASLDKYYLWRGSPSQPSPGPMPAPAIANPKTPSPSAREVGVSFTVHRGEEDGPPVEGADVELVYLTDEKAAPLTIGRGRTDAEGKTRIEAALSTAQQRGGTFQAVINADGVRKDWPLPEFPTVLAWNLWLPNRPPRPKPSEQPHERTISNSIGMKMVLIPAGEFMMGSGETAEQLAKAFDSKAEYFAGEYPQHRVRITKPFYMGQYPVTLGEFLMFYHDADYKLEKERDGKEDFGTLDNGEYGKSASFRPWAPGGWKPGMDDPVVWVTWNDAVAFCGWLSKKEGKEYRLPTEAQWEYACRAGSTTRYCFGDSESELGDYAWYGKNLEGWGTKPVGGKRPNAWGLYDMHGNVWQWCADWYDKDYYAASPVDDPKGPDSGLGRVLRGGGWIDPAWICRSAFRRSFEPGYRFDDPGFRVARALAE
jgi:formylglycine-generating enzyme required for sulfatase activity